MSKYIFFAKNTPVEYYPLPPSHPQIGNPLQRRKFKNKKYFEGIMPPARIQHKEKKIPLATEIHQPYREDEKKIK
jgi:hypothetical protein